MTSRYVVGFDGSVPSRAAIAWAARRAEREGVPLVVAHVDEVEDGIMGRDFGEDAERRGGELVASAIESVAASHPRLELSATILRGNPAWELAHFAEPDDMLVIGTRDTGALHGSVLGSRSVQIAMASACTVAVIPDVDLRFRTGVVAGIDRDVTAVAIGRLAAREADVRGEELTLLHLTTADSPDSASQRRARRPIEASVEAARAQAPTLSIRSRVSTRAPAEALLDASRGKALLVLGPGSLDISRSPIGSIMHEILSNANAPLLIARPLSTESSFARSLGQTLAR